jgi:diguanylate cyclase (GGDEF)-like protein
MPGLDISQLEHRARLAEIHLPIAAAPMSIGTVTCSFGVAGTNGAGTVDVDALIATADEALYRAKRNGRNRIEWTDAVPASAHGGAQSRA